MRCNAITGGGERCKLEATHGSYCWSHAPETADARRRRARRGGKAGGRGRESEVSAIKALLSELTDRVLGGEGVEPLETGRAAVANRLINTRLRAVEVERKIKETEELEARVEELERAAEANGRGGGRRWG